MWYTNEGEDPTEVALEINEYLVDNSILGAEAFVTTTIPERYCKTEVVAMGVVAMVVVVAMQGNLYNHGCHDNVTDSSCVGWRVRGCLRS